MLVWVGVFAAIGVMTLILTRAEAPGVVLSSDAIPCTEPTARAKSLAIWNAAGGGRDQVRGGMASGPVQAYEAAGYTLPMIRMAINCNDRAFALDVANSLNPSLNNLQDFSGDNLGTWKTWLVNGKTEQILNNVQVVYAASILSNYFAHMPTSERAVVQIPAGGYGVNVWMSKWTPVITSHAYHYMARNWGVNEGCHVTSTAPYGMSTSGYEQRLARYGANTNEPDPSKLGEPYNQGAGKAYCNYFLDRDHLMLGLYGELYASYKADPSAQPIAPITEQNLVSLLNAGIEASKARSVATNLTDFSGKPVQGVVHDARGNEGFSGETLWSGYEGPIGYPATTPAFPTHGCGNDQADYRAAVGVGDDVQHHSRWIFWELSRRNAYRAGGLSSVPASLNAWANQWAFAIGNKNLNYPMFRNYESGKNGWYRIGYSGERFGYGPWDIGMYAAFGTGRGFLAYYQPQLSRYYTRMRQIVEATSGADATWRYYNWAGASPRYYKSCTPVQTSINVGPTSAGLMMFYASFLPDQEKNSASPDTTKPTVQIISPSAGTTISSTTSITAAASDNVGVVKLEFYSDGILLASDNSVPYSYDLNTKNYVNGDHVYSVKAFDAAGNVGTYAVTSRINNTTTTVKKCDFNNDNKVDTNDLFILLANINKTVPANTKGDCNNSGKVDTNDLFILLAGFGK